MATQEITIKRRTRKTGNTSAQQVKPQKHRRSSVTRNNSTPSKICPTCGGTGRVR